MKSILLTIAIVIVIIIGFLFFSKKPSVAPTISPTFTASPTMVLQISKPKTHMVIFLAGGRLSVSELTIKVGETITFLNNDSKPHWPVSGPHPVHNICSRLNSPESIKPGGTQSYILNEVKTCPFHDHSDFNNSALRGQIIVIP